MFKIWQLLRLSLAAALMSAATGSPVVAQSAGGTPSTRSSAMADANSRAAYLLGPNDEIEMTVFGQPDMGLKTRIKADGTIIAPFIGTITAAGQTTASLSRTLSAAYQKGGYLSRPSINVEVTVYASKVVNVSGWVTESGVYPLDRPYTVATMVARAGGAREGGANSVILRRANGGAAMRISLDDGTGGDHYVQPGDQLYVPEAEKVYVYGEVNRGGAFNYKPRMTFRQALALAGGPTLAGSTKRITVTRDGNAIKAKLDDIVRPEDVLTIREKLF